MILIESFLNILLLIFSFDFLIIFFLSKGLYMQDEFNLKFNLSSSLKSLLLTIIVSAKE